jgi:hypothetical protein
MAERKQQLTRSANPAGEFLRILMKFASSRYTQTGYEEQTLMTVAINDMDYRSYALPCYPLAGQSRELVTQQFEQAVVAEIGDMDYCLQQAPYTLSKWLLAA